MTYLVIDRLKSYWWLVVIVIVFISYLIYISDIQYEHDRQVEAEYNVRDLSCSFLKERLAYEDQLYSKHPWYDAMKKAQIERCKTDFNIEAGEQRYGG